MGRSYENLQQQKFPAIRYISICSTVQVIGLTSVAFLPSWESIPDEHLHVGWLLGGYISSPVSISRI